jgi:hypothetical protein
MAVNVFLFFDPSEFMFVLHSSPPTAGEQRRDMMTKDRSNKPQDT